MRGWLRDISAFSIISSSIAVMWTSICGTYIGVAIGKTGLFNFDFEDKYINNGIAAFLIVMFVITIIFFHFRIACGKVKKFNVIAIFTLVFFVSVFFYPGGSVITGNVLRMLGL